MSHHRFAHSEPSVDKNLSLFHLPPTDLGVERVQWVNYRTVSQSDEGLLEFTVSGSGHQYVDLQNTRLFIKAKIVKPDGTDLPPIREDPNQPASADNLNLEAFVSPVNLWLHSLFNHVELLMQQEVISTSHLYPYRSYFEKLIYPSGPWLAESELFYLDTASDMDATQPVIQTNDGLTRRCLRGANSTEIDMEGPLYIDLFQQSRYIMDGVDFGLKLFPSKNAFRLMSDIGECQVKITEAVLKVCKVEVSSSVRATHNSVMKNVMTAKYPHDHTEMKSFTVMKGVYSFKKSDMFQGEVPHKIVLAFVTTEAYNGDLQKNPFNLKHCYINRVNVEVDDVPIPQKAMDLAFDDNNCTSASAFRALFEDHPDLNISRDEFNYGFTLFNINTRRGSAESLKTVQKGNCTIEINFAKPLKENMTLILMAKFPHVMEIDSERQITV